MLPRILLFISIFSLCISCAKQVKNPEQISVSTPDSIATGSNSLPLSCIFSDPDTSVEGIILRNSESALKFVEKGNKLSVGKTNYFYSADKKEVLGLTVHPGDMENQVSIISIGYAAMQDQDIKPSDYEKPGTGHGIRLGLSKDDIIQKLGNCYVAKDSTSESIELYYSLVQPQDSRTKLLSRTNMPQYFASYKFKNDILNYIQFGFEAP